MPASVVYLAISNSYVYLSLITALRSLVRIQSFEKNWLTAMKSSKPTFGSRAAVQITMLLWDLDLLAEINEVNAANLFDALFTHFDKPLAHSKEKTETVSDAEVSDYEIEGLAKALVVHPERMYADTTTTTKMHDTSVDEVIFLSRPGVRSGVTPLEVTTRDRRLSTLARQISSSSLTDEPSQVAQSARPRPTR